VSNLTACQQDALTELLNIGIGQAAAALSQMVNEEVQLAVPYVDVLTLYEAIQSIEEQASVRIAAVKQQFTGLFWGDALLLFPEAKSLELVRALLKELMSLEDLTAMEQEALMEVGNVILNACLGSLANLLDSEATSALPVFLHGCCSDILRPHDAAHPGEESVLFLRMDFTLPRHAINGCVVFMVDGNAIEALKANIDRFVGQLSGGE
jgi:chemotaxis protein CheC